MKLTPGNCASDENWFKTKINFNLDLPKSFIHTVGFHIENTIQ